MIRTNPADKQIMKRQDDKFQILSVLVCTLVGLHACANTKQESVNAAAPGKKTSTATSDKTESENESKGKNKKDKDGTLGEQSGGEGSIEDGGEDSTDGPWAGCGYTSYDTKDPLAKQSISSAPIRFHGFAGTIFSSEYTVYATGTLNFDISLGAIATTSNFTVTSADPPNAMSKAQGEAAKINGTRKATPVSASKLEELFKSGSYQGITCGLIPITGMTETTGDHATTVTFDPPLPYLLPPVMSKTRFAKEFSETRTFSGINAKVVTSTGDKVSTGQSISGSASIVPVDASATFTNTEGAVVTVDADYAFRIEFDFGSHETTNALGLYKVATYYVVDGEYRVINVETGVTEAPKIDFIKD